MNTDKKKAHTVMLTIHARCDFVFSLFFSLPFSLSVLFFFSFPATLTPESRDPLSSDSCPQESGPRQLLNNAAQLW